jgi:CheY-like chemotaxis protein
MGFSAGRPPQVLVVDDEVLIGRVLTRTLGQFADVEVANSGAQALRAIGAARAAGYRFDLVICDVMMPEMSGPELFARVKETDPETAAAFVFVTGGASIENQASVAATGVRCMHKPLNVEEIRALLGPSLPGR